MMRRNSWLSWMAVACVIVPPVLSNQPAAAAVPPGSPLPTASQRVTATMMGMPLQFEANHGQVDAQVKFLARGKGYTLFLTPTESMMILQQREATSEKDPLAMTDPSALPKSGPIKQAVVRMKLEGANPSPAIDGMEQLPGIVNYFIGNDPEKWRTKIPTYAKVQYKEAYSGIDLAYYGNQGKLEYDFIVAPGADPNQIKLVFEGASEIKVADSGDLLLTTALGDVWLQKPVVYQLSDDGHKTLVAGNYMASPNAPKAVGIQLASYDRHKPLVIDPVLSYLTYLGGSQTDSDTSIAVDGGGNAYLAGETISLDFPATVGSYDPTFNGNSDIFVVKLNTTATALSYVTYLGGTGLEVGGALPPIAVDSTGSAYVAGATQSADFPVTPSAFQTAVHQSGTCVPPANCSGDGFVTKLDPTGSALMYSTYFGGTSTDGISGLVVDSGGNAYVTGDFRSTDFPITPGTFSATFNAGLLAKLNPTGTALVWSTRLTTSGSSFSVGTNLALDSVGNVIVVGGTLGTVVPLVNPLQSVPGGGQDAFVWKFNPTGTALVFSTYLGGIGSDWALGVAVDASDNIFVTGYTESLNFPTTPGAFDASLGGTRDMFVTKLMPSGLPMVYSTFLGGSGRECVGSQCDVRVDSAGHAYVAGDTTSPDFPLVNPIDSSFSIGEIVLAKIKPDGSALVYSTFLGGTGGESQPGIALGVDGAVYVAAYSNSANLPVTPGVVQPTLRAAGYDIFVAKISSKPIANAGSDQSKAEGTLVTLNGAGSAGGSLTYIWTQVAGPPAVLGGATSDHPTFTAPGVPPTGATVTFELVVCEGTSSNCSDPDTVNVHITNVNQPPVADAGPDQTLQEGSPVQLNGTASYDPDVDALTYTWLKLYGPPVTLANPLTATPGFTAPSVGTGGGQVDFELIVTDPHGLNHADYISVFITNVNQIPTANAGVDQTVNETAAVTLNGTLSTDPDLDTLNFTWTQTAGLSIVLTGANTASPTFTAPPVVGGGTTLSFRLIVSDGQASSAADRVDIHVLDTNDPPVCTLAQPSVASLWPPNHTMVPVTIMGVTDPNNHAITIVFQSVTQDEPVNGLGDGDTSPDAAVSGNQILLRAERAGTGNGRVYVVHFTATDAEGAHCSGTVKVAVPHSKKDQAIEGPQLYNSFAP